MRGCLAKRTHETKRNLPLLHPSLAPLYGWVGVGERTDVETRGGGTRRDLWTREEEDDAVQK